jgi:serine/threonine-protein kinase
VPASAGAHCCLEIAFADFLTVAFRAPSIRIVRALAESTEAVPPELDCTLAESEPEHRSAVPPQPAHARSGEVVALHPKAHLKAGAAASTRRCPSCGRDLPASFAVCPHDASPLGVAPNREDALIGTVLGGTYRLVRVLGKGGMGRLYEAEHTRLGRRFAVKVLHEAHAEKREAVARFEREAEALARISSDQVLDVVDVLRTVDGRTAIVTGLLEGEDLQRRVERAGTLPAAEAIEIARQVCRGLSAAHAVSIIHRDLKPSNLFLTATADGTLSVKILDFGVAKFAGDGEMTRTGVVLGTPAYMAPEQARGSNKADARSDVYAVGAVLYRAVTGKMPYDGKDVTATLSQVLHESPPRPRAIRSDIPLALEAVIQKAMARDPNERPRSALELEAMLGAIAAPTEKPAARVARGAERAMDTMVLGRGEVARATEIEKAARMARPRAVAQSVLAVLAAACGGALALHAPVALLARDGAAHGELALALAIVGAVAAGAGAITALVRTLLPRWTSAPEVDRAREQLQAMTRRGLVGFGGLVALALTLAALGIASPSIPALSLVAVVVGALVAVLPALATRE